MDNTKSLLDISSIVFDSRDIEDRLIQEDVESCKKYMSSHYWCLRINRIYYGGGVPGKVAVFLIEITPSEGSSADNWVWVVCGDLPIAYIRADLNNTPSEALADYISVMKGWANAVLEGSILDQQFTVDAKPSKENARMLLARMDFLEQNIIGSKLLRE